MNPIDPDIAPTGWTKVTWAKTQPEYRPLVTLSSPHPEGHVLSRWRLTWRERLAVLCGRDLWILVMTFRDKDGDNLPLQPIRPSVGPPRFE